MGRSEFHRHLEDLDFTLAHGRPIGSVHTNCGIGMHYEPRRQGLLVLDYVGNRAWYNPLVVELTKQLELANSIQRNYRT